MICDCIFCVVVVHSIFYVYVQEKYCSQAKSIYLCACLCEFVVCSRCLNTVFLSISHLMLSSCCPCWSPWLKEMAQIPFSASQERVLRWDPDPNISLTALALTLTSVITYASIHCENICDFSICGTFLVSTAMRKIQYMPEILYFGLVHYPDILTSSL